MYNVSPEYIQAIKKHYQECHIAGSIYDDVNEEPIAVFDDSKILAGTFIVQWQNSSTDKLEIGTVFVNELSVTLQGIGDITRYNWFDSVIRAFFFLKTGENTSEEVPIGWFRIQEAVWTNDGIRIKAYDNMIRFDKYCMEDLPTTGTMYQYVSKACAECDVVLGMTEAEFGTLPNGTKTFNLSVYNEIETYRDLISLCAQTMGAFATIDRDGRLVFRSYNQNVRMNIDVSERWKGAEFSGYTTRFDGVLLYREPIDIVETRSGSSVVTDSDYIYELGFNPFLQDKPEGVVDVWNSVENINYVPFRVTVAPNPMFDLGDVLTFSGGYADRNMMSCINKIVFSYPRGTTLEGYGENPRIMAAKSAEQKRLDAEIYSIIVKESEFDPNTIYPNGALVSVVEDY